MSAWNITASADLIQAMVNLSNNSSYNSSVSNSTNSSSYAEILSQQIAQLEQDAQSESENLSSQTQDDTSTSNSMAVIETIKRFRPDGSIMITTYKDGKIDSTTHIKPHLVPVPDFSAPPTPDGQPAIKMVQRFTLAELLMM